MEVDKCTGCLNHAMVPKACILYFAELVRCIHTHIPVYISIRVQCLGEGKNFSFDLNKAIILCKNSFLGGHRKTFPPKH